MQVPYLLNRVRQHGTTKKTPLLRPRFPHPLRRLLAAAASHLPCLPHCPHRIPPETRINPPKPPKPPNPTNHLLPWILHSELRSHRNFPGYTSMDVSEPPPTTAALYSLELFRIQQKHFPPNPRNPRLVRIGQIRHRSAAFGECRRSW